ncbi:hypothetical protein C2S52_021799 [Perilla frutescens var. hirtella]|nr:hypothetical protein C2S52_021799 [Perilla frutescens var. hirtella]
MNMNELSKLASNVLAGKNARPCDSCLMKRARWFCAADDAFLCQSCDAAVHSANQLAGRHQRVRLETSSTTYCSKPSMAPSWHQGFTKKARTPRQPKQSRQATNHQLPLVPEMGSEEPSFPEENGDDDEQLLFCRVPIFDPSEEEGVGSMVFDDGDLNLEELAEFAVDVESLLGTTTTELLILDDEKRVKIEEEDEIACHLNNLAAVDVDGSWDDFDNCNSMKRVDINNVELSSKKMLLRLNYEAVIAAWAAQGSPWADGIRPPINLQLQLDHHDDEYNYAWLDVGKGGKFGRRMWGDDGDAEAEAVAAGREARVWRYREKRRTRMFSKKIRYELTS